MTDLLNALFYGDNLVWLRDYKYFPPESVDLIYLDPPFNSKADYNLLFNEPGHGSKSQAQIKAFDDTWNWDSEASAIALNELAQNRPQIAELISWLSRQGKAHQNIAAYLTMMAIRLIELHRILMPSGSIYLHCDPTASHYLKVLMDAIFSPMNFRNEVIWRRTGAHGPRRSFGPIHDTLLFYSKTDSYYFKPVMRPYMQGHVESRYSKDETGQLKFTSGGNVLTGAGTTKGESGKSWKGFDPSAKKRHWAIPQFLTGKMPETFKKLGVLAKLDALYDAGLVEIKEGTQWPTPVRYLLTESGQPIQDIWAYQPYTEDTVYGTHDGIDKDVAWLGTTDPDRLGYQTQKPLGLASRIIRSSCPENGLVLDPFCGCGTAIAASQNLGRRWLGIDVTWLAIDLVEKRLKATYGSKITATYEVHGKPFDVASAQALANKSKKEFEIWAVTLVGAAPRDHDGGVDGIFGFVEKGKKTRTIIVQIKGGSGLNPGMVRDLIGTVKKEGAAIGLLVTLKKPTIGMTRLAVHSEPYKSELWNKEFPSIQIRTIEELLGGKGFDLPPTQSPLRNAQLAQEKGQQSKAFIDDVPSDIKD